MLKRSFTFLSFFSLSQFRSSCCTIWIFTRFHFAISVKKNGKRNELPFPFHLTTRIKFVTLFPTYLCCSFIGLLSLSFVVQPTIFVHFILFSLKSFICDVMHNTLIAYKNSAFNISSAEFKTNMMKSYERWTHINQQNRTTQFSQFLVNILPFSFLHEKWIHSQQRIKQVKRIRHKTKKKKQQNERKIIERESKKNEMTW